MDVKKPTINIDTYAYLYCIMNSKNLFYTVLPLICIFFKIFDFNLYCVEEKEKKNMLNNKIEKDLCLKYNDDKKPWGFIINRAVIPKYICYRNEHKYDPIYIFTYEKNFDILTESKKKKGIIDLEIVKTSNKKQKNEKCKKIKYLHKTGWYGNIHFCSRDVDIKNDNFNETQKNLYENIMNFYNENNYVKVFISGNIGEGKTYFSYLLAKYLNCFLCDSFDPTEPSSTLDNVYSSVDHKYNKPLIILIDEVDIIFSKITDSEPLYHKKYPIMIKNKIDWNSFLDKIEYGLYKNIILILCSNNTKQEMDNKYDKSFLRTGRINIFSQF